MPRAALCTAFFFVASLVHLPVGPASVHLSLLGLVGVIMGRDAFVPVLFGLALQALLFQHGGLTTLGLNAVVMGVPAYAAWLLFRGLRGMGLPAAAAGGLAGGGAALMAGLLTAGALALGGEVLRGPAVAFAAAGLVVVAIEAAITAFAVRFFHRVEPSILGAGNA